MQSCPSCSAKNSDTNRFCAECGAALSPEFAATVTPETHADAAESSVVSSSPDSSHHGRFLPGTRIADRYRIVSLVGKGGVGEVYRADDLKLGHTVALKFLPRDLAEDAQRLEYFHTEVRLTRQISHPNVCRVYDIGEVDGQHFLSMEYVDGEDLRLLLRRIGRLPRDKGVDIARQLCAGLAAAHDKGVLHRDLKPANIMLDGRGQVRITDFGLAKLAEDGAEAEVAGTPAYMAPEQLARGETTIQSDLYSLGLILYELFTGEAAHKGGTIRELLEAREESSPSQPSALIDDMDRVVERVILRCLEREPHERPNSAHAVAAALPGGDPLAAALAAGETPSPELVAAAGKQEALQPWAAISLAIAGLALFIGVTRWAGTMLPPLGESPEVLIHGIDGEVGVLETLGYTEPAYSDPVDQAWGFVRTDGGTGKPENVPVSAEQYDREQIVRNKPEAVNFWYRQSANLIVPQPTQLGNSFTYSRGSVGLMNPPSSAAGEVTVILELAGHLQHFEVAPIRVSADESEELDWAPLFELAGLEERIPDLPEPLQVRDRLVWELPDDHLRIEAGAYDGRWTWFDVSTSSITEPLADTPEALSALLGLTGLLVWLFSLRLTVRNLKQGRADRIGALRLALFLGGVQFAFICLRSHLLFSSFWAADFPVLIFIGMLYGVICWGVYIAAEPLGRRVWPEMFVSSSRLLSRPRMEWRDPLIGRSVLVGLVAGPAIALPVLWWPYDLDLLAGQRQAIAGLLTGVLWIGSLFFGVMSLVLLRLLVKRTWLAAGLNVILLSLIMTGSPSGDYLISFTSLAVLAVVSMAVLLRWGIVAYLVANVTSVLILLGRTTDWSAWHSQAANMALALVVALALYGIWAAIGDPTERPVPSP